MAVENAVNYIRKVQNDEVLAAKLNGLDTNELVDHAGTIGYQFTPEELHEAIDEVYGDLDEADLDSAAGGTRYVDAASPYLFKRLRRPGFDGKGNDLYDKNP